ncbi:MAG: tetraacyldisaccharide 4'-kinase [Candidatus Coatesbacteria bacterium]|nr:MAG: tetraacyldisaccharide 4'-kinase [Candidatus Coatesbacteria bacterium]
MGRGSGVTRVPAFAAAHRKLAGNAFARVLLRPLAWIWQAAAAARRYLYRRQILNVHRLPRPVIGVGNLALGGAGKTPFVIFLGQYLVNHGVHVAIISRGYGRASQGRVLVRRAGESVKVGESLVGDEALMIARALPEASVVVAEDRVAAAAWAIDDLGAGIILLDDAFQGLRLKKDLNVLLLDARRPPGPVFPAGYYREGPAAARAADLVVFTKCRENDFRNRWLGVLEQAGASAPRVEVKFSASYLRPLNREERLGLGKLEGAKVLAFAGIADFDHFADDLAEAGAVVARRRPFPDHHRFTHGELADAEGTALVAGCDFLVTTAKDEARLEGWRPAVLTYVLEQAVEIITEFDVLNDFLDRIISAVRLRGGTDVAT